MTTEQTRNKALLVLPRLRVQNANAISSPMTWGFPAITAFTGLMTALTRLLGPDAGIAFYSVGIVCHSFEPQVTQGGYTRSFHLTRNPVLQDGSTAAIVEEGRAHLDITLVFEVELAAALLSEAERAQLAAHIGDVLAGMRIAGGSVVPPLPGKFRNPPRPSLKLVSDDPEERRKEFRKLSRRLLPGFALVSRDDLLQTRLAELQKTTLGATLLDAWLDLSRLNHRAVRQKTVDEKTGDTIETVEWVTDSRPGWIVPMPVGFAALSELHDPGTVAGARDPNLPFQFVESVYSMGQWINPLRLTDISDLLWEPFHDSGLYRCFNAYQAPSPLPVSPTT
ncbi:type I-F CRISPR-associated protein Csy2 [Nitrosovibrio tenuis]|uniref:CRISPR-associated protein, Csy2 family n=1 Tax=Nitrosovibrio tenuis TaxID=1233 RepID=A0A1H7GMP9_9PROT|nr:type I-F CRISPR-associated protein Csy2 [Nitrosovibrio tenuis]SEK39408.1 CRISPR-associated protein, Csy2 family [Nitrosovibrio tenuis]